MILKPFKFFLVLSNFAILTFLSLLIIDHFKLHYDKKSLSSIFHYLCFIWLSIKGIFWISTITTSIQWSDTSFYLLYWMPTPIEFGSFMILPIFFSQIIYPSEWKSYWKYILPLYVVLITGLIIFQAIWILVAVLENTIQDCPNCLHPEYSSDPFRVINAICFSFLGIIQGAYGIKLKYIDEQRYNRFIIASPNILAIVNAVLFASFLSRGLYHTLVILGINLLPDIPLERDGDIPFIIMVLFEFWDYIPTILSIVTITSKSIGNTSLLGDKNKNTRGANYYIGKELFPSYGAASPDTEALINDQESPLMHTNTLLSRQEVPENKNSIMKFKDTIRELPSRERYYYSRFHNPPTLVRTESNLSETEAGSYIPGSDMNLAINMSHEKESSLINYYRKQRVRGSSISSENSSYTNASSLPNYVRASKYSQNATSGTLFRERGVDIIASDSYIELNRRPVDGRGRLPPPSGSSDHDYPVQSRLQRESSIQKMELDSSKISSQSTGLNLARKDLNLSQQSLLSLQSSLHSTLSQTSLTNESQEYELQVEPSTSNNANNNVGLNLLSNAKSTTSPSMNKRYEVPISDTTSYNGNHPTHSDGQVYIENFQVVNTIIADSFFESSSRNTTPLSDSLLRDININRKSFHQKGPFVQDNDLNNDYHDHSPITESNRYIDTTPTAGKNNMSNNVQPQSSAKPKAQHPLQNTIYTHVVGNEVASITIEHQIKSDSPSLILQFRGGIQPNPDLKESTVAFDQNTSMGNIQNNGANMASNHISRQAPPSLGIMADETTEKTTYICPKPVRRPNQNMQGSLFSPNN